MDIYHWAYVNFQLQTMLCQNHFSPNETIEKALAVIGYDGTCFEELNDRQKQDLIEENGFFSAFQTGHRIVTFSLKRSGLDKDMLHIIHESINKAYETVVQEHGKEELSQASYNHTIQTLSVFRP